MKSVTYLLQISIWGGKACVENNEATFTDRDVSGYNILSSFHVTGASLSSILFNLHTQ